LDRGQTLVPEIDRQSRSGLKLLRERLNPFGLLSNVASQRKRQPDDDAAGRTLQDQRKESGPVLFLAVPGKHLHCDGHSLVGIAGGDADPALPNIKTYDAHRDVKNAWLS
jgi:hypothetical protein